MLERQDNCYFLSPLVFQKKGLRTMLFVRFSILTSKTNEGVGYIFTYEGIQACYAIQYVYLHCFAFSTKKQNWLLSSLSLSSSSSSSLHLFHLHYHPNSCTIECPQLVLVINLTVEKTSEGCLMKLVIVSKYQRFFGKKTDPSKKNDPLEIVIFQSLFGSFGLERGFQGHCLTPPKKHEKTQQK